MNKKIMITTLSIISVIMLTTGSKFSEHTRLIPTAGVKEVVIDTTDYMSEMITAATLADFESGIEAQEARGRKIEANNMACKIINFEDLYYLAKIAQAEAGDLTGEIGEKVIKGIMEVVLNRVASPEFKEETVKDVIYARGQYYVGHPAYNYFENVQPTERVVKMAVQMLEGERSMTPDVIFHSNGVMGGGSAYSVDMGPYGTMHFSYSNNREVYK